MPIYVYENAATGERVEAMMPMARRNFYAPGFRRVITPQRVSVPTGAKDPTSADGSVPKALRDLEMTMPADQIAKQAGFSVETLKSVWQT